MFEIVTDFTCDLPKDVLEKYEIKRVPMYIVNNGERIRVDEDFDYIAGFYRNKKLQSLWLQGKLKTSQPAIKDFLDVLQSSESKNVLVITVSSKLSGTYNVAKNAEKLLKIKGYNITVFDSKTASIGLNMYVQAAAELREEGKDIDEVVEILNNLKVRTFAAPMDIKYLLNSGRLNLVKYALLKITNKIPILKVDTDGELKPYKLTNDPLKELIEAVKGQKRFLFGGTLEFIDKLPEPKVLISPVVAVNTGPIIGLSYIED